MARAVQSAIGERIGQEITCIRILSVAKEGVRVTVTGRIEAIGIGTVVNVCLRN